MNVLLCTLALFCMTANQVETSRTADTLLYIRTVPSGAQILLDGKPLGNSDGLFPVRPGQYKIVVDLRGHEPHTQQVSIRNGKITRIELELNPSPSEPDRSTKTVMLPDVDRRDGPTVLDLASGELIENLARGGDVSAYVALGKGDLWQDDGYFGTVRDARAMLWDGTQFVPFKTVRPAGGTLGYGVLKLPCRLLIATAEKTHYDVTILWMDGQGSARIDYRHADPSMVPQGGVQLTGTTDGIPTTAALVKRMQSASHLSAMGRAMLIYANDYDDMFPPNLDVLVKKADLHPKYLVSPRKPEGFAGPDYVYIKGQNTNVNPSNVVAYENPAYCRDGINVLYLDSHVAWEKPDKFLRALEATYKRLGRPVPNIQFGSLGHIDRMSGAIRRSEILAKRMQSASHLSTMGKAMLIYANDYDDMLPPNLEMLVSEGELHPKHLVSPSQPRGFVGPGYVYVVGQKATMHPSNVVAYENPGYCQDGINVLYLDSHVAWEEPDVFLEKLEATYKRLERPMPNIQFRGAGHAEPRGSDNAVVEITIK